jgi:hypothetical protein
MRRVTATFTATWLGVSVWTCGLGTASADPVDPLIPVPAPADPAALPADPAAAPGPAEAQPTLLGQFAQAAQLNPFATMQQMLESSPQEAMFGAPPAPGTNPGADPISLALTMNPRNFRMPTADQDSPYALAPNDNPSLFDRVNAFKGVHALTHSNLGRMPGDQLGQPLPGTAPAPGSNMPAGLEQYYVPPEAPAPAPGAAPAPAAPGAAPAAPDDPLLLMPPPVAPPPPAG